MNVHHVCSTNQRGDGPQGFDGLVLVDGDNLLCRESIGFMGVVGRTADNITRHVVTGQRCDEAREEA